MVFGCLIWSRVLRAKLAAGAARMSGLIGNRLKPMPDRGSVAAPAAVNVKLSVHTLYVTFHFDSTYRTIFRHSSCKPQRIFRLNSWVRQLFEPVLLKR